MSISKPERGRLAVRLNPVAGAVAVAIGGVVAIPVQAQDGVFEDIVVTATRREVGVQDIPFNITAVTGDMIDSQRLVNLSEVSRMVPGLTLTDQGARDSDLLTVRGLNTSNIDAPEIFLGNSGGDTVATYIGDIPLYVDLRLLDIERVEVLIGPQGTLYGAGTLGGAIRYLPKRPVLNETTVDLHARGYGMSQSDDAGYGADVVVNFPLVEDKLAFRGLVGFEKEPGFVDYNFVVGTDQAGSVNPEDPSVLRQFADANDAEWLTFRGSLLWEATDDLTGILSYTYQKTDSGGRTANSQAAFGTGQYEYGRRFLEPKERENQLVSLEVNWDLGFAELTSATGYSEYSDQEQRDQTDLLLDLGFGYETFPNFAAFTADNGEEETITQELRLVSTGDGPWNWIVGGFYSERDSDQVALEFTPGYPQSQAYLDNVVAFGGIPPDELTTGDLEYRALTVENLKQIALFGELGYQITDAWQVTVGARWFEFENDFKVSVQFPFFDPEQPPFPNAAPVKEDDVIFKINTSVDLDGMINAMSAGTAYFTISEGYRNGRSNGLDDCVPGTVQTVCATPDEQRVNPDTTTNYELGIKSTWLDSRFLVNASLFFIDWKDIRVSTVTENGLQPIDTNGSEAESKGVELASQFQINDNWSIVASYAYTNAELSKEAPGVIGGRFGAEDGLAGDRLPGTPEHQGSFGINYTQSLANGLIVDVNYGFTAQSDILTKIGGKNGGETLDGFTIHNLSASLSGERWTATVFADNLTDKFAVTGTRRDRDFIDTAGLFTLRGYFQNMITPRTIGLDLRYNFDF